VPAQRILDLDDIARPELVIRTGGVDYVLPGDVPCEKWLRIAAAADLVHTGDADSDDVQELNDRVLDLFRIRQPDLDELPLSAGQILLTLAAFYDDEIGEAVPDPPARRVAGTRSSSRKKTTRSASPKS